jgi:glycosyltransferase involved in cell wall biosynthesis
MRLPLISVIITTYNYAHTVGTAIRSALAQDYPNLEVLVLDNASTDATPALLASFANEPRLRYHRHPQNVGMVPNHNAGLRLAKGEYISFLSADDFLMPGFISRSYAFLQAHPEVDVRYGATYFVDPQERFTGVRQMAGQPLFPYEGKRNEFACLLAEGCYMCFPTMLMRRDLYERFGELDETIKAADYEIVLRWAERGVRFAYDPEPVAGVRLHPDQQSSTRNYTADGSESREVVELVRRFVRPETEHRIAGFERRIAVHARQLFGYSAACNPALTENTKLMAEVNAASEMLEEVRVRNRARPHRSKPTIVVLAGKNVTPIEESLRSLVDQTHTDWEAILVQSPGTSWAPLVRYCDPRGRIRNAMTYVALPDAARLNQALRVAGGNVLAFMHAGTVWRPDHLEKLVATFETNESLVAFSRAVLAIDQVNGAELTMRRRVEMCHGLCSWPQLQFLRFASELPLDALAFRIEALDEVGLFNEGLPVFEDWEYALRLTLCGAFSAVDSEVEIRTVLGFPDRDIQVGAMPGVAKAIHDAYPDRDAEEASLRQEFRSDVQLFASKAIDPQAAASAVPDFYRVAGGFRIRRKAALA